MILTLERSPLFLEKYSQFVAGQEEGRKEGRKKELCGVRLGTVNEDIHEATYRYGFGCKINNIYDVDITLLDECHSSYLF